MTCTECIKAYRVSSSDFRQIAIRGRSGKGERLFRAAITAFCSLPRPTRREIAQVDDLTLSLLNGVSVESRRFVAAALSECEYPPPALVRRLAEEPVDIAAPLLIRSGALTDIDLIALIGRHGLPHARAIARRKNLHPTIASLIRALERPTLVPKTQLPLEHPTAAQPAQSTDKTDSPPGCAAEEVRHRLRSIMAADREPYSVALNAPAGSAYAKLRETALTGNVALFQSALADALGFDVGDARPLTDGSSYSSLLVALRALDVGEDKAFLIAVAIFPKLFPHPEAIRLFLSSYRTLQLDVARRKVEERKAESQTQPPQQSAQPADSGPFASTRDRLAGIKAS